MNQSLYFEMSHKGLVSDEAGNIKIVEADSKSEEDSIQKVLEYENEIEMLEKTIESDQDSLDEEKRQLSLDRIQYEADKNELANNMLKFNEIVGTFTDGVGNLN